MMAEVISLSSRRDSGSYTPVVVVQSVRSREAVRVAKKLKDLLGGWLVVVSRPVEKSDCTSCSLKQSTEEALLSAREKKSLRDHAPVWLITPADADPWAIVDAFAPGHVLSQFGFRLSSFITVVHSERLFDDWVSTRRILPGSEVPMVEALADQIDFSDFMILAGASDQGFLASDFLRRLNNRSEFLSESDLSVNKVGPVLSCDFDPEKTANGAVWRTHLHSVDRAKKKNCFRRTRPFHPQRFFDLIRRWPEGILRCEGTAWIASESDVAFTITQVGPKLFDCSGDGYWLATLSPEELREVRGTNPDIFENWHPETGDRMTELAFVWESDGVSQDDVDSFLSELEGCVLSDFELRLDWARFRDPFREEREKEWARAEKRKSRRPHSRPIHVVNGYFEGDRNGNTQEKDI